MGLAMGGAFYAKALSSNGSRPPRVSSLLLLAPGDSASPIHLRLFKRMRELIIEGALTPGAKLPSSRSLSKSLGISRNSVLAAFDQLCADGWLETRAGSGAYVSRTPPSRSASAAPREAPAAVAKIDPGGPFEVGVPALDVFPLGVWNRLQGRRWARMPRAALRGGDNRGALELRTAIAAFASVSRGLACTADNVIVTTGARASLDLAIQGLGLADTQALVEAPSYYGSKQVLARNGVATIPLPVDAEGADLSAIGARAEQASFALVTPACQFPIGVEMSLARRARLLAWARAGERWILEDDYDCETAGGQAQAPLAAAERARVVYAHAFNKILFPSLRIGYLIADEAVIERCLSVLPVLESEASLPNQLTLADFIDGGYLDRHIRRTRDAYAERRSALIEVLEAELGDHFEILPSTVGGHVRVRLRRCSEAEFVQIAASAGLRACPMDRFRDAPGSEPEVLIGFCAQPPGAIRSGARRLRRSLEAAV